MTKKKIQKFLSQKFNETSNATTNLLENTQTLVLNRQTLIIKPQTLSY